MQPEHEAFMLAHVEKMGFLFIIDRLKAEFPALGHKAACEIYDEFKAKHAEDEKMQLAEADLRAIGQNVADAITSKLTPSGIMHADFN